MAHNLTGNSVSFTLTNADTAFKKMIEFMDNVGYQWVKEEVSENEVRYYLDESKKVGFSVVLGSTTTTGIYVVGAGKRSGKCFLGTNNSNGWNSYYKLWLYSHVSEDECTVYLGDYFYYSSSVNPCYGLVAAKDSKGEWSIFYSNISDSSQGNMDSYIADSVKVDRNTRIGAVPNTYTNYSNSLNSEQFFALTKCPSIFRGVEFKSLYLVLATPNVPELGGNDYGLGCMYTQVDDKVYRLVGIFKNYLAFAFPVSD